ncbi:MAG: hypothetical protein JNN10_16790 [Sphingopyxis sp.]|nr:hypothetical protein [Sphingopyxis sp.]
MATSDAAFRGGACPTPEYTIAYTGNYTTSADANRRGPANIAVYENYDGKVKTWPRCSVWVLSREGPALIVPKGADFGFAYHDAALCRVLDIPLDHRADRIKMARKILSLMPQIMACDPNPYVGVH